MRNKTAVRFARRFGVVAGAAALLASVMLPIGANAASQATFTSTNVGFYSGSEKQQARCVHGPKGNIDVVNCNIYNGKQYVWLNGGPVGAQLGAGDYFFAVLEPGGQPNPNDGNVKNLHWGKEFHTDRDARTFSVDASGTITSGPSGHILNSNKIRLFPYADTGNPGGVYILAICSLDRVGTDGQVSPRDCKYDAFKVREGKDEEPPPPLVTLSGMKYYDANTNGQWDAGEPGLPNWPIDYANGQSGTVLTDANGNFTLGPVLAGDVYEVKEKQAVNWIQTGNTVNQTAPAGIVSLSNFVYTADLTGVTQNTDVTGLNFGNVCVVPFDGRTPGFWQNPNGQALITSADLQVLRDLHLVNPDGSAFDPIDKSELIGFNQDSNAQNMASQLSRHLAATVLNVRHGFVDGNAVIFGDGRTVNQLIADADASLAANPVTTDGHPARAAQTALKDLLASINEGTSGSVPSTPDQCPAPVFE